MTVIAIKYADDAKPNKKYGSIKSADGTKYLVPAGLNGVFKAGTTVDIPLTSEPWTETPIVAGRPGAAGSTHPATPAPTPPAAEPQTHGTAQQSNLDAKDFAIFVTGIVGRAMGSGNFGVTDIDLLTKAAIAAYRDNLG